MDEDSFRRFYESTARSLRSYLLRMTNDGTRADDILQESYLRLLEAKLPEPMEDAHRKNYLFRIATNVARTEASRSRPLPLLESVMVQDASGNMTERPDVHRLLGQLSSKQREMLWLAYVERFSHREIAEVVGAKQESIRPMLARARQKLAELLRQGGFP
jgi:RNA polymerase sigma-70 factor (ECF subfamily)